MTVRTRQANLRSSIYQGADGRWHGRVSMGTRPDGSPDRRHVTGKTRAQVTLKVRELELAREHGGSAAATTNLTLAGWLTQWVETIAAPRVRAKSLAAYRTAVYKHLIPGLGNHRLASLRTDHVEAFYNRLATQPITRGATTRGYRPATIHQIHRTLRTALAEAHKRGHLTRNPAQHASLPTSQHVRDDDLTIEPLTVTEAQAVIHAAAGLPNGLRYVIALALGLRQGEALGLQWKHLDLDANHPRLHIRQQLQRHPWQHGCTPATTTPEASPCGQARPARCPARVGGGLVLTQTKSRAGRRTLILPAPIAARLHAHRAHQDAQKTAAGTSWHEGGFVFTQPNGRPLDPRQDARTWKQLLHTAGVPPRRLHDARHTAATFLLLEGVDPRTVMELMGWSNSAMLHRYQHVVDDLKADAASRIARTLYPADLPAT